MKKHKKQNQATLEFYENLYRQYKYLVLRIAKDLGSDRDAAEDILQDTMVKLIKTPTSLADLAPKALFSYVVKTAVTVTIDYQKKSAQEAKSTVNSDSEIIERMIDCGISNDEILIQHEQTQQFYSIFNTLSESEIDLLNAKYIDGRSISELAEMLNCKEGTVKSRLFRAKQHAKELFEDWR